MNVLQDFLAAADVSNVKQEVDLGGRLAGMPFTVKAMTQEEYNEYQRKATTNPANPKKRDINTGLLQRSMIIGQCIVPNFKDAEFLKKCGVQTPEQALQKTLLAGELSMLQAVIMDISGFDVGVLEEEIKDVKNTLETKTETFGTVSTQ